MGATYTADLKKILRKNGCKLVHQGEGDHEFWESPITGQSFPVDGAIKLRHTGNAVLKQAGIDKAF